MRQVLKTPHIIEKTGISAGFLSSTPIGLDWRDDFKIPVFRKTPNFFRKYSV